MRLKKNPQDVHDYYVEQEGTLVGEYFERKLARQHAKAIRNAYPNDRVRIFHARFTLVSDSRPKVRKSASAGKGAK